MRDEPLNRVSDRSAAAINQVDGYIVGLPEAKRLSPRIIERDHNKKFTLGWSVPRIFSDGVRRELHVLTDGDFPYTPPRIAIADRPDVLSWPHLEKDGLLCILPPDSAVSSQNSSKVTAYVLAEACRLIEENISGRNVEDFRLEFLSYWRLATNKDSTSFISILEPKGLGRQIAVWHGRQVRVVGENAEVLERWLSRRSANLGKGQKYKFYKGVLIWLPEPLLPAEYPHTATDVRVLARERSPEGANVLEDLAAQCVNEIDVLLGFWTPHGACFAAVTVRPPRQPGRPNPLEKGFRPSRVPRDLLIKRYLSSATKVTKTVVERADHLWIHGRDQDSRQESLRGTRVAVLGCGSLGGGLARLLAQAGIGNLLLVDPDTLDWPNVGRHSLGADSVCDYKAKRLEQEIIRAYPHLGDISSQCKRVGPEARSLMGEVISCDLIVSTMGNWAAENFLNDVQQDRADFPPIIYGWVEANAVAAHAVLMPKGEACLRCGVNDKGRPHLEVTEWPNGGDSLQAPACGAIFTPYGPAELCWAHALLAETVIEAVINGPKSPVHRIWIGRRSHVDAAGGKWTLKWVEEMGDPGAGGITIERSWPASKSCSVCSRRVPTT